MGIVKSMSLVTLMTVSLLSRASLAADIIQVDEAFWKDSRSTNEGGGITATQSWSGSKNDGFQLSWQISQSNGLYHYTYSIADTGGGSLDKKLKEFILQVGDAFTSKDYLDSKGSPVADIIVTNYNSTKEGNGNESMSGNLFGVLTSGNNSTLNIDFYTSRAPVWGSFYADAGNSGSKESVAFNTGFTNASSTPDKGTKEFNNYIARPGGDALAVPEPATMVIMGSSLAALYIARRKKYNTQ